MTQHYGQVVRGIAKPTTNAEILAAAQDHARITDAEYREMLEQLGVRQIDKPEEDPALRPAHGHEFKPTEMDGVLRLVCTRCGGVRTEMLREDGGTEPCKASR